MQPASALGLRIGVLYPDRMRVNGDDGNLHVLTNRCRWRGIGVETAAISSGAPFDAAAYDLLLFGGGEAWSRQKFVADDLLKRKARTLREAADAGMAMLVTGGGYQLFGHHIEALDGVRIPGIGLLDMWTEEGPFLMAGDIVLACDWLDPGTLVGFERHRGRTYLGENGQPVGRRLAGYGNNGDDTFSGCRYKNVFGTYVHGPVLPRNPHFADLLIRLALHRRHGAVPLAPIDDALEWAAHRSVLTLAGIDGKRGL